MHVATLLLFQIRAYALVGRCEDAFELLRKLAAYDVPEHQSIHPEIFLETVSFCSLKYALNTITKL